MICYIMRGLPGSGKSTLANKITDRYRNWGLTLPVICSADHYRYENGKYVFRDSRYPHTLCLDRFKKLVDAHYCDIIVDNTNATLRSMRPYVEYALPRGYTISLVSIQPIDIDTLVARNVHDVPRESIEKMLRRWVPNPTVEEILKSGIDK